MTFLRLMPVPLLLPALLTAQASTKSLAGLSWLAGCWEQRSSTSPRRVEEQWLAPRGGTFTGGWPARRP